MTCRKNQFFQEKFKSGPQKMKTIVQVCADSIYPSVFRPQCSRRLEQRGQRYWRENIFNMANLNTKFSTF